MGQRANFEETYTGKSLQGSYIAGVYYPDKTRVGWWKNGYPEYFAKVLNSCNWIGLNVKVDGETLDLNTATAVTDFYRELDMKSGLLKRSFQATLPSGKMLAINTERFVSIVKDEIGALSYSIVPINFSGSIEICSYLDFDVKNEDSNYNEKFWESVSCGQENGSSYVHARTKKTRFEVSVAMRNYTAIDGASVAWDSTTEATHMCVCECACLLYTSPSPRDQRGSRMPSSA